MYVREEEHREGIGSRRLEMRDRGERKLSSDYGERKVDVWEGKVPGVAIAAICTWITLYMILYCG